MSTPQSIMLRSLANTILRSWRSWWVETRNYLNVFTPSNPNSKTLSSSCLISFLVFANSSLIFIDSSLKLSISNLLFCISASTSYLTTSKLQIILVLDSFVYDNYIGLVVSCSCSYLSFYLLYLSEDRLLLLVDLKEVDLVENNNLLLIFALHNSISGNGPLFCPTLTANDPPIFIGLHSAKLILLLFFRISGRISILILQPPSIVEV